MIRKISFRNRLLNGADALFDNLGIRPIGVVVFSLSVFLFSQLISFSGKEIRVDAVALARLIKHPSQVDSVVTKVFVETGDRVTIGSPLVELSPHFVDQKIERIDSQIEQLINESKLAQARLLIKEERWADPSTRINPSRPSLETPTTAYYEKKLEALALKRNEHLAARDGLVIKSEFEGLVANVQEVGSSIGAGRSVASVMPEFAEEIVAYVDPSTDPSTMVALSQAFIVSAASSACRQPGAVERRGAAVVKAPSQLTNFLGNPVYGMPIHVSIPDSCQLGNGQILKLEFLAEYATG